MKLTILLTAVFLSNVALANVENQTIEEVKMSLWYEGIVSEDEAPIVLGENRGQEIAQKELPEELASVLEENI